MLFLGQQPRLLCSSETTESCLAWVARAGHEVQWTWLSIGSSLQREEATTMILPDTHKLSMSAVSCEWCSFILGCGLVLICAFQFSVKQLNSPSSCGDDSSHLLASYTSKTIEKMSFLILGDSHFKTMKQFFLSPEHHHVALVCHLSCSHTHKWCSFGLSQWGSL